MFGKNKNISTAKFSVGNIVKVRSREEISQSLDSFSRHKGCLMMNQMWDSCRQGFKVLKVVNNFFDEYQYKMYRTHSPLYILDGLICDGVVASFDHRCDRSCYLLWHEEWLERPQG